MRLPKVNQWKRRKPKTSEIRAAMKLAAQVSKFLADLLAAPEVEAIVTEE
jgi:hypothetical protein